MKKHISIICNNECIAIYTNLKFQKQIKALAVNKYLLENNEKTNN